MDARETANALEGLLRSEAWRMVEAKVRSLQAQEMAKLTERGARAEDRAEAAGAYDGLQRALDVPGRLHELHRSLED